MPPAERIPPNWDRAPEPLLGFKTRSKLATTSAASKGLPSLNVTPWRSLKVHTSPLVLGAQLTASFGLRAFWLVRSTRYSAIW